VLITEVIVGLIILFGLFGWMDILIFAKWFGAVNIEIDNLNIKVNPNINCVPDVNATLNTVYYEDCEN
jgi:hypothetical protein